MANLWNYVQEYPGRLRDQFTQGMQQFAVTRNPVAALGAINPTTPFIQDAALQAGGLIAPQANQLSEAVSQASENLGLGPLAIPEVTDEQLAPFLMLGMGSPSKMGFYSPSGKALTTAPGKGTSKQYLSHLKKEPGATREAKQTGLIQRLEEAPGTLTREEVVSMWNPIELTETVRQELPPGTEAKQQELEAKQEEFAANTAAMNRMSYEDRTNPGGPGEPIRARQQNLQIQINNLKHDLGLTPFSAVAPKWADRPDLNLPGGEEPKEILVQLPVRPMSIEDYESQLSAQRPGLLPREDVLEQYQNYLQNFEPGIGPVGPGTNYKSSHWDEPNVLAHIRTNKRDVGGVRALHAEEFQSDWHQRGQKKGYQKETVEEVQALAHAAKERFYSGKGYTTDEEWNELSERVAQWDEREKLAREGVPDAPYKKDWHELAFKRFLMEGVNDPSVDRITWTSGAVQADRYNLAKYINEIEAEPNENEEFSIAVKYKEGNVENLTNVPSDQLADYVGKEMAEKIVADKGGRYSGLDLEVGAEFHKNLYDKKIPQFAKKFLKKYGVEPQKFDGSESAEVQRLREELKVVAKNFPNMSPEELIRASEIREAIQNKSDNNKYWYIDITPEMRQDLQQKGVPLAMNDRRPQAGLLA